MRDTLDWMDLTWPEILACCGTKPARDNARPGMRSVGRADTAASASGSRRAQKGQVMSVVVP
jgi:hypothetical protein